MPAIYEIEKQKRLERFELWSAKLYFASIQNDDRAQRASELLEALKVVWHQDKNITAKKQKLRTMLYAAIREFLGENE
jgi:hypothetical protein